MYRCRFVIVAMMLLLAGLMYVSPALATDETVSNFTLKDLAGKQVSLSDFLGKKVILINFWATWCIPCQHEMPHLEKLNQKLADKDFVLLAISIDKSSTVSRVRTFLKKHDYTFTTLLDTDSQVINIFNPKVEVPFTIVIGKDKKIKYSQSGYHPGDEKVIEEKITELLSEGAKQ